MEEVTLDNLFDFGFSSERYIFTDYIFNKPLQDKLAITINKLFAFLYTSLLNSPLQSKHTVQKRAVFHSGKPRSGLYNHEDELSRRDPSIRLVEKNQSFRISILIFETLMIAYHIYLYSLIADSRPSRILLSSSPPPGQIDFIVARRQVFSLSQQGTSPLSCMIDIENFLAARFGQIIAWDYKIGLETGYKFIDETFFLGQTPALQTLRGPVRAILLDLAIFISTCGLITNLVGELIAFDVPPFLVVYDPEYMMHLADQKLRYYINSMQESYANMWSMFSLDDSNCLTHRDGFIYDQSPQYDESSYLSRRRRIYTRSDMAYRRMKTSSTWSLLSSKQNSIENGRPRSQHLDYKNLSGYSPSPRTQICRPLTLVVIPPINTLLVTVFSALLSALCLHIVNDNITICARNQDLKSFLNSSQTNTPKLDQLLNNCSIEGKPVQFDTLRDSILRNLISLLRDADESSYRTHLDKLRFSSSSEDVGIDEDTNLDFMVAMDSISPVSLPTTSSWIVVDVITASAAFIFALYIVIYILVMGDLIYWLFELQMKLSVCHSIFILYEMEEPRSYKPIDNEKFRQWLENRRFNNIDFEHVAKFILYYKQWRTRYCWNYARRLVFIDHLAEHFQTSNKEGFGDRPVTCRFLHHTYIDFRMFADQIDQYRPAVNFIISFGVFHGLNIIMSSRSISSINHKILFVTVGLILINIILFTAAFIQSQCTKLIQPIYSILVYQVNGGKIIRNLASMWNRALADVAESQSRFSFRAYSFNITYALLLQFNLGVLSLYVITMERTR